MWSTKRKKKTDVRLEATKLRKVAVKKGGKKSYVHASSGEDIDISFHLGLPEVRL